MTTMLWNATKTMMDTSKNWSHLLPRCAYSRCPGRHSIVNGFLRRGEGIHCNRSSWFCGPDCLEAALTESFSTIRHHFQGEAKRSTARLPLGQLMVLRGHISESDLLAGLRKQSEQGGLIGECLIKMGVTTEEAVTSCIASQWACPLFPRQSIQAGCADIVPIALQRAYEILPVHMSATTNTIYIAHGRAVDYSLLYAIEQILGHRAEPCVLTRTAILESIELREEQGSGNEVVLETKLSSREMARVVRSYAQQMRSESIQYTSCGEFVWVQMKGVRYDVPLLFRCAVGSPRN